jgi:hypothetical protein
MCTVTFIPLKDTTIITSNRDEKYSRKQALPPQAFEHNGGAIIYPKDADAGGTWIAMNEDGNAAVLLNGAFTKHVPMPPYKESRGQILLELIKADRPVRSFVRTDLYNIEPFTLIMIENRCLYECRWDGNNKHCKQLPVYRPHIWSSATLYTHDIVKKRELWFAKWLNNNPTPSQEDVIRFHLFGGENDKHNDLLMNRQGLVRTVSITSIELTKDRGCMTYFDLKDYSLHQQELTFYAPYALQ